MTYTLYHGDCLDIMPTLEAGNIDAVITDLPYNTLEYGWDCPIDLSELWKKIIPVLGANGSFVTTASQPFTSGLIVSNLEMFKYEYAWKKSLGANFLHAKNMPVKIHENIVVFSKGSINHPSVSENRMTYNPQLISATPYTRKIDPRISLNWNNQNRPSTDKKYETVNSGFRYPSSVIEFANGNNKNSGHPTEKPVALCAWLILTYTNPGDTILDPFMGSGTTGVACIQTGRNFIGIEKELKYFEIAEKRIAAAQPPLFVEQGKPEEQPRQEILKFSD
jgi:site-specific DNA-methyltransferase (adenine-specific)